MLEDWQLKFTKTLRHDDAVQIVAIAEGDLGLATGRATLLRMYKWWTEGREPSSCTKLQFVNATIISIHSKESD